MNQPSWVSSYIHNTYFNEKKKDFMFQADFLGEVQKVGKAGQDGGGGRRVQQQEDPRSIEGSVEDCATIRKKWEEQEWCEERLKGIS